MSIILQSNLSTDLWLSGLLMSESVSQTWLATLTDGETPPMSRVTSEVDLVPSPHLCTQCKEPAIYCPRFSKHWTCLETNYFLPVSKACSNASSPTNTSPESCLHAQIVFILHDRITHEMVMRPHPSHGARSTQPCRRPPGQVLIQSLTLGCT